MLGRKSKRYNHSQTEGRINFTSPKYLSRVKAFLTAIVLAVIAALVFNFITYGVSYLTLVISATSAIGAYIFISYIYWHSQTASLKGDTLIMNSMNQRSLVMSVSCVKRIKSRCLFGFCWTTIKYSFDGRTGWVFIVTNNLPTSPERSLLQAIKVKEENKKANHKPGSVITQQA